MSAIKIDPRDFINPPYLKCPKCNAPDSFGVLTICREKYFRRCKKCWHEDSYPLPKLSKKIIYIDQFAISNMMKMLNPRVKTKKKSNLDQFWKELFKKLDGLCKLQLIICPDSGFHTSESLVSPYFQPLKRMYELLSNGVTFYDHETIKRFQICQFAKNWISGMLDKKIDLDIHSVVLGDINVWQDRLIFSVNLQYGEDWINDLRKDRQSVHQKLHRIFTRWQSEKDRTFDDWFNEECTGFGEGTIEEYFRYLSRFAAISTGVAKMTADDIFIPPSVILIYSLQETFKEIGIEDSQIWPKTFEYLTSPDLKNIPFIKISSMIWAAIARQAATGGRKRPPDQGISNDIEIISLLLPYCDALFIDKECHGYLREVPLRDAINYETKFFSLSNKEEFLHYLDVIEENTPREHLEKVDEVYGKSWREPYTTLYKDKK